MKSIAIIAFLLLQVMSFSQEGSPPAKIEVNIGDEQTLVFLKISPKGYNINYPDFYISETEVTNAQFKAYCDASGRKKDDTDLPAIIRNQTAYDRGSSSVIYYISDETTLWKAGKYPEGLSDHPVALLTLDDTFGFCDWLSKANNTIGLFRLPSWNEWMIAAYGAKRNYPWGDEWNANRVHMSFGFSQDGHGNTKPFPRRTEPVKARPQGRNPEGVYGLLGNVDEYILNEFYPYPEPLYLRGSRGMGGGFTWGAHEESSEHEDKRVLPRNGWWGESHRDTNRISDLGFRVVLDPTKNSDLPKRSSFFKDKTPGTQTGK